MAGRRIGVGHAAIPTPAGGTGAWAFNHAARIASRAHRGQGARRPPDSMKVPDGRPPPQASRITEPTMRQSHLGPLQRGSRTGHGLRNVGTRPRSDAHFRNDLREVLLHGPTSPGGLSGLLQAVTAMNGNGMSALGNMVGGREGFLLEVVELLDRLETRLTKRDVVLTPHQVTVAEWREDLECPICMTNYQLHEEGVVSVRCGHVFHKECVTKWFETNGTCPLCRADVEEPDPLAINENDENDENNV